MIAVDGFDRQRLDISDVGGLGIGHDRRRIRIDQHDLIAFLPQRLAGLRAGVIKFAGLSDDDWAGANDQNFRGYQCVWAFRN